MPRVCTSQPAKAELQVPGLAAPGSTTAGIRGQWLNRDGCRASWAPAKANPRAQLCTALHGHPPRIPSSLPRTCGTSRRQSPAVSMTWSQDGSLPLSLFPCGEQSSLPSVWTMWLTDPMRAPPPLGGGQTLTVDPSSSQHVPAPCRKLSLPVRPIPSCGSRGTMVSAFVGLWKCPRSITHPRLPGSASLY